ncbi:hypothetical protein ACHAO7_007124 [Fusarium culmorum]
MTAKWDSVDAESQAFLSEVKEIEAWWQTDRQKGIKRLTFGTTDPLVVKEIPMSMRTVYVSGGLSGHAMANFPGDDHADYPADLVPSIVRCIFNTQLFQDQSQTQLRMKYPKEERKHLECIDYMLPIVADADMGFGTLTGCMELVRNFVEAGVAMVHIDDLAMGLKKFTNGEGRTIVPTSEYLTRLTTVRMTYDIMGVANPRDHPYVLGATKSVPPFAEAMQDAVKPGKPYATAKTEWKAAAGLMTFDQAVQAIATEDQYKSHQEEIADLTMALRNRCVPQVNIFPFTAKKDMHEFHSAIRAVYPDRMFAFGFTSGYDFSKGDYSPEEIEAFHSDIAKMGVVWQF